MFLSTVKDVSVPQAEVKTSNEVEKQKEVLKRQEEELRQQRDANEKEKEKQKALQETLKRQQEEIENLRAVEKEKQRDSQEDLFLNFLRQIGLELLHASLVEHGYDSVELLRELEKDEFDEMVKDVGIKSGQKVKLRRALFTATKYEYIEAEKQPEEPGSGLKFGDYTSVRVLGKGNFGEAYKVRKDNTGQYFVLKKQLCRDERERNSVLKVSMLSTTLLMCT